MRVLFVNHTSLVSGAERSLLTLMDGLAPGVVAGLACPPGSLAEVARARGVEVEPVRGTAGSLRLHPWHTPIAISEVLMSSLQVARAARQSGATLLHANSLRAGVIGAIACRFDKRPLVVHVRDCLPDSASTRLIRHLLVREANEVVAISDYVANCFRVGLSTQDVRLQVIDNAVDVERFQADAPSGSGSVFPGPLLAIVGQITSWKGHDTAIRTLHELRTDYPHARLLIVGGVKFASNNTRLDNRGYLADLHELVGKLGLEDAVDFLGERDDVPEIMARVDAVLVPSIEEPFGRTVAEAMAIGTPAIATSVGGPAELINDGATGLLAPPGEPAAWSGAIRRIVEHPEWASEMGRRASEVARERFATERHVAAMMEVYESVEPAGG